MTYTINPNAKDVWIRDNEDTMDLSPITDASSVYLENGRTLEQELGEGSMVSNVATVDNSMSKVIDGTLDGAYESCVLKGRTLVNLFDKSKVSPDHTSYTLGSDNTITYVADNGFANGVKLNHLKPNTKYALFFDVLAASQEPNIPYRINDDGTNYNINIFGAGQDNPTSGFHSFTTGNNVSDLKFFFYTNLRNVGFKLTLPVIIEYQYGMEDWDIPYFEGLCDSKMPILRNVGKNLFDGELQSGFVSMTGAFYNDDTKVCSSNFNAISSTTNYTLKRFDGLKGLRLVWYDENYNFVSINNYSNGSVLTATSPSNAKYFKIGLENAVDTSIQVQLEESSTSTSYEDYKTNILRTSEEIVLREVGGVQDTYNPLTGEYVQRIGELVVNGSESWGAGSLVGDTMRFGLTTQEYKMKTSSDGLCDKIPYIKWNSEDVEHVRVDGTTPYGNFTVWIKTSRLSTSDTQGFKQWLSQNPLTVQYILAEPVTTIVEPSTIPFAYENGHVILESGYEGQSLLPTLEYSTVVNKTGQVEGVAKVIQKQEKQLTMLEQMLIQNIIGLDYSNTVLALNLEIDEVI